MVGAVLILGNRPVAAQVQIRIGDSTRTLYSELHEGLRPGTPPADSAQRILEAPDTRGLWPIASGMLTGKADWNAGLLALTRIAELRDPTSLDSVRSWRARIQAGAVSAPPGTDPGDLLPALHAIELELERDRRGDLALLAELLPRIPDGNYDTGDAWVFGRMRLGAADTSRTDSSTARIGTCGSGTSLSSRFRRTRR